MAHLFLEEGDFHPDDGLLQGREGLFHVVLLAPQEVWPDDGVEPVDLVRRCEFPKVVDEAVQAAEALGVEEVEQAPELRRVVLQRRAREEVRMLDVEGAQVAHERRVLVLHAVRLVDHEVAPLDLAQAVQVLMEDLKRGDHHLKLDETGDRGHARWRPAVGVALLHGCVDVQIAPLVVDDNCPRVGAAMVEQGVEVRPRLKLALPVLQGGQGRHDEERPANLLHRPNVVEHRDGLYCLAKAHLVGEEHGPAVVPREEEPVDALELVGPQRVAALVDGRLLELLPARRWGALEGLALIPIGAADAQGGHVAAVEVGDFCGGNVDLVRILPRALFVGEHAPLDEVLDAILAVLQGGPLGDDTLHDCAKQRRHVRCHHAAGRRPPLLRPRGSPVYSML